MGRHKTFTEEKINQLADDFLAWTKGKFKTKTLFWFKDWAIESGFCYQRISEFAKENEKFADTLKIVKEMQESILFHAGTNKNTNPAFIIFSLKNVAGWRDVQEQTHIFPDGVEITIGKSKTKNKHT